MLPSYSTATATGTATANATPGSSPKDKPQARPHLYCLLLTSLVSLLFILSTTTTTTISSRFPAPIPIPAAITASTSGAPLPPSFGYLLSGDDHLRLLRLLHAVFHPRNLYLIHLHRTSASPEHRIHLARSVRSVRAFRSAGNVFVIGEADFANPRGSSALAATLHGAALLLRLERNWDWFVNLDAADYPLVTQDDLLHVFSFLPRDLNFVQHSSNMSWREYRRIKPVIVDPGLYHSTRTEIFYATQKREMPNAYKLFTGFPSVVLSRKFVEHCILGTDNLPRALLMYYANTPSPQTNYFQTVLCNSPEFNRTVVNHNLHYIQWDSPSRRDTRPLSSDDLNSMTQSGAAFATRFSKDDQVLDRIDREVLNRGPNKIVPGGWCLGEDVADPCCVWGSADILRPSSQAMKLAESITRLLSEGHFHSNQCIWE